MNGVLIVNACHIICAYIWAHHMGDLPSKRPVLSFQTSHYCKPFTNQSALSNNGFFLFTLCSLSKHFDNV